MQSPFRHLRWLLVPICGLTAMASVLATAGRTLTSSTTPDGPATTLHYAGNGNFGPTGAYLPGSDGFDLADVSSVSVLDALPAGDTGLVWVGQCAGVNPTFLSAVEPFVGNPRVFGFYLMDEPDPTGVYSPLCPASNLRAESNWIHSNDPGARTFIVLMNESSSTDPTYMDTYNPANTGIDLYGVDPYPCRTELDGCDYSYITKDVAAAEAWGIPRDDLVPVYQAFGLGGFTDDGGGRYAVPTASEEDQILATWAGVTPTPAFDYAYSWGSQDADSSLAALPALQSVFLAHNAAADPPPSTTTTTDPPTTTTLPSPPTTVARPPPTVPSPTTTVPDRRCRHRGTKPALLPTLVTCGGPVQPVLASSTSPAPAG